LENLLTVAVGFGGRQLALQLGDFLLAVIAPAQFDATFDHSGILISTKTLILLELREDAGFVHSKSLSRKRLSGARYDGFMTAFQWIGAAGALGAVALLVAWRPLRRLGKEMIAARAREAFRLQRERLEAMFFDAAAATGKPRGLRWKNCNFEPSMELVRERGTGLLMALVPVTIAFEAIEGGPMEGVEAVGNLRTATAVFSYTRGHWETAGKAVFNMDPAQTIAHFGGQYEKI
jgi:hypothetical protein